ncbi:hypothetical protein F5B19DRAFT_35061 [Rostrohypoxylon terebratum]|nr:hypothetical protein F5B19DRAFT_35061 [Rostrohypoxylon terebratum]
MVREAYQRLTQRFRRRQQATPEDTEASPSDAPRKVREQSKPPLALEILERPDSINPQLESPIFAKLPREIREQIWRFSLTRYEDFNNTYEIHKTYTRPGQAGNWRVAVQLLLTCRAVYVEAFLKPFQLNPLVVFDGAPQDIPPSNPLVRTPAHSRWCRNLRYWQFANLSAVEMTVQQFQLEGGSIERVSRVIGTEGRHIGHESRGHPNGYAHFVEPPEPDNKNLCVGRKITNLTIRMLRTDWWSWATPPEECRREPSERLRLEPMINVTNLPAKPENSLAMTKGYEQRKLGAEPDFDLDDFEKQGRWGMQIGEYWPDLDTLELVLETFGCKQDQLDKVLDCAKLFKFPLPDGFHLAWSGKEEGFRWRGAEQYEYESPYGTWFEQQNRAQDAGSQDLPFVQWMPPDVLPADGQEFVVRTLIFERRRDTDRPT